MQPRPPTNPVGRGVGIRSQELQGPPVIPRVQRMARDGNWPSYCAVPREHANLNPLWERVGQKLQFWRMRALRPVVGQRLLP